MTIEPAIQPAATLELWLQRRRRPAYAAVVTFRPPGDPADQALVIGPAPRVSLNTAQLLLHRHDISAYGSALTSMLFADRRVREALIAARHHAHGAGVPLRLRLRLDPDDPALHTVRWELLRDPTAPNSPFLCTDGGTPFSRYLASPDATPVRRDNGGAASALVAVAAPGDLQSRWGLDAIDADAQIASIAPALTGLQPTILRKTTMASLVTALLDGPTLLYLICHGSLHDGRPYLWIEGDDGSAEQVDGALFVERLRGLTRRPTLVILGSCQSAGHSDAPSDALVALGPRLAQAGVGAVLALHDQVASVSLQGGMPVFFSELRRHGQADLALAAMRAVLAVKGEDWWQPVLFLRLADGAVLQPAAAPHAAPLGLPRPSSPQNALAVARELEQKRALLELLDTKIAFYQQRELISSDPATQFQLSTELGQLRARRKALEAEIARLGDGEAE